MVRPELLLAEARGSGTGALFEWHSHECQQPLPFFVGFGCCGNANIHSSRLVQSVESDLRKHALVFDSHRVVPIPVEATCVHALEIPSPRKPQVYEAVQERVHHLSNIDTENKQGILVSYLFNFLCLFI